MEWTARTGRATAVLLAALAGAVAAGDGTRTIALDLSTDEAVPELALRPGHLATVSLADAAGAPLRIVEIESSDGIEVGRPASHPHVATLRQTGRRRAEGSLVVFVDGVGTPVHLSLSPDAPYAHRVVVAIDPDEPQQGPADGGRNAEEREGTGAASAAAIETVIHDYLLANPQVLRDALDPARQLAANARRLRDEIVGQPQVPAAGDLSGAVTVVEFFDYGCGYCKRSVDAVQAAVALPGVRLELREYPILGEASARTARLALAAGEQGRYLDAHWTLMERPDGLDEDSLPEELAAMLGLDAARLRADMASPQVQARIDANRQLARRIGVTGTPAFLVFGPDAVEISPGGLDAERLTGLVASVR